MGQRLYLATAMLGGGVGVGVGVVGEEGGRDVDSKGEQMKLSLMSASTIVIW